MPLALPPVRPHELQVACHPHMPAMRGSINHPVHGSLQMPVNRTQYRPPFEYAEQSFSSATCVPIFRQPPLPPQCQQFNEALLLVSPSATCEPIFRQPPLPPQSHDALLSESPLRFSCRPRMIAPFEPTFQSYAVGTASCAFSQMEYQPVVSNIGQPFLPPQYMQSHQLSYPSQVNAPVASVELSSESIYTQQVALNQTTESSAVPKSVDEQNRSVFPTFSRNQDIIPQKGSEKSDSSSSNTYACWHDEHASQSQWRQRKMSETRRLHSVKSQRYRDSRGDRSLSRDRHKDTAKQRHPRLENQ